MNPKSFIQLICVLSSAGIFLLVTPTQADIPGFALSGVSDNPPLSFTGTRGWQFGRAGSANDIYITQLGIFDSGGDGLMNAHEVGLWHADPGGQTGTLLASVTVPAGTEAPLIGGYRWVSISPVLLPFSVYPYDIGALYSAGDADTLVTPQAFQFAPDINPFRGAGKGAIGADLTFPANFAPPPCFECPSPVFWEVNLQYTVVPEPSVWLLLSPAVLYLFLRHRKRR